MSCDRKKPASRIVDHWTSCQTGFKLVAYRKVFTTPPLISGNGLNKRQFYHRSDAGDNERRSQRKNHVVRHFALGNRRKMLANHRGKTIAQAKIGTFDAANSIGDGVMKSTHCFAPSSYDSSTIKADATAKEYTRTVGKAR